MTTPASDGPLAGLISDAREIPAPFRPREPRRVDLPTTADAGPVEVAERVDQEPVAAR